MFRGAEAGLFLLLALLSGKRIRPLPGIILLLSVTAASLLVPFGDVLVTVLGFPVTLGALESGLARGTLLLGLFYLSKFSVARELSLPGRLGTGLARVFYYFERFTESRERISIKDLPGSLDAVLMSVSNHPLDEGKVRPEGECSPTLLIIPLAASLGCWIALFI